MYFPLQCYRFQEDFYILTTMHGQNHFKFIFYCIKVQNRENRLSHVASKKAAEPADIFESSFLHLG